MKDMLPIMTHEKNMIEIWEEAVQNDIATRKSGHAEFNRTIFIRITVPGDNKSNSEAKIYVVFPDSAPHPLQGKIWKNEQLWPRFGRYIEEYLASDGHVATSGTPIEQWALINKSQAQLLKFNGVHTVEALTCLTDSQLPAIGSEGRKLQQQAKDWLATAANSKASLELAEQKRALEARLANVESQLAELGEAFECLSEVDKAKVQDALSKRRVAKTKAA